nr:RHS domain-containing protein [Bacillus sp. 123MFChir2]
MKSQGQTVYYHYNPRGDVIAMTDENGQVVANYEYDAWGNVLKSDAKGIAAERRIAYKALRRSGVSEKATRKMIARSDRYFSGIGVKGRTKTRIPGDRR